jgi:hypothetical protein
MSRSYTSSPPSTSVACSGTALAFFKYSCKLTYWSTEKIVLSDVVLCSLEEFYRRFRDIAPIIRVVTISQTTVIFILTVMMITDLFIGSMWDYVLFMKCSLHKKMIYDRILWPHVCYVTCTNWSYHMGKLLGCCTMWYSGCVRTFQRPFCVLHQSVIRETTYSFAIKLTLNAKK